MVSPSDFWDSKADREANREQDNPRKQVHTDLLWRLINKALDEECTSILDAGGGTGRFSIPLAKRGYDIVHLDISHKMLDIASENASDAGVELDFIKGDITDLSIYPDKSFDTVLCLDSPLSFCFPKQSTAVMELTRVCRKTLVLCVLSRLGVILEGGIIFDLKYFGKPNTVLDVFESGNLVVTQELLKLQNLAPSWHAFTVDELEEYMNDCGFEIKTIIAPGALSTAIPVEMLTELLKRPDDYKELLDFEEQFDSQKEVLGLGFSGAGGLALVAERI